MACATPPEKRPSSGHLRSDSIPPAPVPDIPRPVQQSAAPPKPVPAAKTETYSVVVKDVRVQELLFALARDARLNVDIHPGIAGTVTLNAIDQTLPQLLNRIARQTDMRYELDGPNLVVMPDLPYLRTYKIDYVNMTRDTTGNVAINTQIASVSPAAGAAANGTGGNVSSTKVDNVARNRFWETLEKNVRDILRETDKEIVVRRRAAERQQQASAAGSAALPAPAVAPPPESIREYETLQAASVMVNPETGLVLARATSRQHGNIQEFLDHVTLSARRQVLIEATIVEVRLNENYQQGIDWQYLRNQATRFVIGQGGTTQSIDPVTGAFTTATSMLPSGVADSLFTLAFRRSGFTGALKLLESFGTLKVLSSPKLSVLNNQSALLKVVDNIVYFQVKADTTSATGGSPAVTNFTTTPQSVSVGLVMSVTPQVSETNTVMLNVRPTISRITGSKRDPHPALPPGIPNFVPEIQTREMESLLSVNDGDIAVLGGLMQDQVSNNDDAVPGVSAIPLLGKLFFHRNDTATRTELVIFLRPTVVRDASINGSYIGFRGQLPGMDFFAGNPGPPPAGGVDAGGDRQQAFRWAQ